MKLSTSINIMDAVDGCFGAISAKECFSMCKNAGFEQVDYNFYDQERRGMPLGLPESGWERIVKDMRAYADSIGIRFNQTHVNFYDAFDESNPQKQWDEEKVRRGIIGSGILGAPWAVYHVSTLHNSDGSPNDEASFLANAEILKPLVALAEEHGTGLALENLGADSFARFPENLVRLVQALDSPAVGVCWDFGHANIIGIPQAKGLAVIGKHLKATHVADNMGVKDLHYPPFFGEIDWTEAVKALYDIGYDGDFTYEVQGLTRNLPMPGRQILMDYLFILGEYTIQQGKQAYATSQNRKAT